MTIFLAMFALVPIKNCKRLDTPLPAAKIEKLLIGNHFPL